MADLPHPYCIITIPFQLFDEGFRQIRSHHAFCRFILKVCRLTRQFAGEDTHAGGATGGHCYELFFENNAFTGQAVQVWGFYGCIAITAQVRAEVIYKDEKHIRLSLLGFQAGTAA